MSWLRLDDSMGEHRKTRRLFRVGGLDAFGLHTTAMLHCARYLTDGFVDREFVGETLDAAKIRGKRRDAIIGSLIDCGQWSVVDGGWQIHDYLDYNPTRVDVEAKRTKDAERKAAGRRSQSDGSPRGQNVDIPRIPSGVRLESDGPVPTHPIPVPARRVQGGQQ